MPTITLISPERPRPRFACPFYGFYFSKDARMMVDQHGNQCAGIKDSYCPCYKEKMKDVPDWEKCMYNHTAPNTKPEYPENEEVMVYPEEFGPEGLTFFQWFEWVMGDDCPRP